MTTTLTDPDAPATTVRVRYENLRGAPITLHEHTTRITDNRYHAACTGCHDGAGQPDNPTDLDYARVWANDHAAHCRALPQPTDSADGA